jgi:hypothetical protein
MRSIFTKSIFAAFVFLTPASTNAAGGGEENEKRAVICLEVLGVAVDVNNKPIDGVQVKLYQQNEELEWTEVTSISYHEHSFLFKLSSNEFYTIEVSKPGYVSRLISVSTNLPDKVKLQRRFKYEFEVQMFPEKKGVDDYYLDFPVAMISYNERDEVFDYNTNYTRNIKQKIKETTGHSDNIRIVERSSR